MIAEFFFFTTILIYYNRLQAEMRSSREFGKNISKNGSLILKHMNLVIVYDFQDSCKIDYLHT